MLFTVIAREMPNKVRSLLGAAAASNQCCVWGMGQALGIHISPNVFPLQLLAQWLAMKWICFSKLLSLCFNELGKEKHADIGFCLLRVKLRVKFLSSFLKHFESVLHESLRKYLFVLV